MFAVANGLGLGNVMNGNAQGIGMANANAGPNGFGVAIGTGIALATPFGNFVTGIGNSAAGGK